MTLKDTNCSEHARKSTEEAAKRPANKRMYDRGRGVYANYGSILHASVCTEKATSSAPAVYDYHPPKTQKQIDKELATAARRREYEKRQRAEKRKEILRANASNPRISKKANEYLASLCRDKTPEPEPTGPMTEEDIQKAVAGILQLRRAKLQPE